MYNDSLKFYMRTKHPTDEGEEKTIKRSKENDGFRNVDMQYMWTGFWKSKTFRLSLDIKNIFKLKTMKNMIACIVESFFLHVESLTHIYVICILLQKKMWSLIEVKWFSVILLP